MGKRNYLKPFILPAASLCFWLAIQLNASAFDNHPALSGALLATSVILFAFAVLNNPRLFRKFPGLGDWLPWIPAADGAASGDFIGSEELAAPFIRGRPVRLAEAAPRGQIIGKTFEDCDVFGPAVMIAPSGTLLITECIWQTSIGGPSSVLYGLAEPGKPPPPLAGAIFIDDVTFRRCRFVGITILVPKDQAAAFAAEHEASQLRSQQGSGKSQPPTDTAP